MVKLHTLKIHSNSKQNMKDLKVIVLQKYNLKQYIYFLSYVEKQQNLQFKKYIITIGIQYIQSHKLASKQG